MNGKIDIVLPWVDGADPAHIAKREAHSDLSDGVVADNFQRQERTEQQRWQQQDEIYFTLQTIGRFAPWVNAVFIVTDQQSPDLARIDDPLRAKIHIIDHAEIFAGSADSLPNFNSASIGTACAGYSKISDRYLAFNDDTFFTKPVSPSDFFTDDGVVLRGGYLRLRKTLGSDVAWNHHQINSAILAGAQGRQYFHLAHVCQPVRRDILGEFFDAHPDAYHNNIRHRFREKSQFNITSLNAQLCIGQGRAELRTAQDGADWHVLPTSVSRNKRPMVVRRELAKFLDPAIKLGCINDVAACLTKAPDMWGVLKEVLEGGDQAGSAR